ncbi:SDR family NAD(P)-dependent oxidoreductase [Arthrobacter sp. JZ12]|uniref:SDR family NAD(P)-dependent oxidoreductase n=1 Tax=Arthrobacter sp. JZ12 TaxID=2654190 RepID=UPI002B464505|nr:SDR family NAD(P)-dependent oxidoreductase [Arthrobacter sp. JZ12]WRH24124.1 SDR family NAD(P)-dependent oxidoreductase [Arthrobacter sp. JZ12]
MADRAMVTGATAGLGAEFADQLAAQGRGLILVARNAVRLEEKASGIRNRWGVPVEVLAADLHNDDDVRRVLDRLRAGTDPVSMLVNNAGYGLPKSFEANALEDELNHAAIHLTVPLALSHAALQGMLARGAGRIVNVASVAGFTPRSTYGALKAAMINFSRWANFAYADRGVVVMALCPGFVHTEFHDRMGMDKSSVPRWMWLNAAEVVGEGLKDLDAGKAVSIPSRRYKVLAFIARNAPSSLVARLAARGR